MSAVKNSSDQDEKPSKEIRFRCSSDFLPIMRHLNACLMISTYRLGKVAMVQANGDQLSVDLKTFEQAMGIAVSDHEMAIGTRRGLTRLSVARDLAVPNALGQKTATAFISRSSHITGNISIHDMAWCGDQLWAANTLFSCLCTFDSQYNFVPRWKPDFISELAPEDRCHLNGMAADSSGPRFVSVLSKTDQAGGWRDHKTDGGCLIDVQSGETVLSGLCMPHSPRLHDSKLWFLNSGKGELNHLDLETRKSTVVETVPGYTRGLSFGGQFAFVGMSQIRETNVFGGLPICERRDELRCGVAVIDLTTSKAVAWFEFQEGVEEVFAVKILPNAFPAVLHSPNLEGDDKELWVIPPL